jgi:hypothetical protein
MVMLRRKRVLAAKLETTVGTPISLGAGDGAFNAYDVEIQASIDLEEREGQGAFNYLPHLTGAQMGELSFKTDLSYSGSVNDIPSWANTFLPACGWVLSTATFTPRSFAPGTTTSDPRTLTMGVYEDGVLKQISGAMGTFVIQCPAGKTAFIEWTFTGCWVAPTAVGIISPTYPTAKGLRYASATTTFDSVALTVENVSIDAGNNVIMRESAVGTSGYISALVTNRKPQITANPESVLISAQNRFNQWVANSEASFSMTLDGPSNSEVKIVAPKAQINTLQEGNRNDIQTDEITWTCNKNGTTNDQELSIEFVPISL